MPLFFVPLAESSEEAERVYEATRLFVGAPAKGPRISGLSWHHNGQAMSCKVGEALPPYYGTGQEPVIAIFDADNVYMVCTPSRGVLSGGPVLAGKDFRSNASYFDSSES